MLYLLGLALLLANTDVNDKMKTVIKRWLLKTLWRYNQAALVRKLRAQGHAVTRLDLGGGLGVPYSGGTEPPSPASAGRACRRWVLMPCLIWKSWR